jgi:stress response protein YsnF
MTPDEKGQTPGKTPEKSQDADRIQDKNQVAVPLHTEEVSVAKRRVVTGQVRVGIVTKKTEQLVDELLDHEHVEIERTAIGKQVDKAPPVREEGDTLIIPILEEVVVVERRLVLKEEVRVRRTREKQPYQERVVVRKQEAVITRL